MNTLKKLHKSSCYKFDNKTRFQLPSFFENLITYFSYQTLGKVIYSLIRWKLKTAFEYRTY